MNYGLIDKLQLLKLAQLSEISIVYIWQLIWSEMVLKATFQVSEITKYCCVPILLVVHNEFFDSHSAETNR